jgi:hypothetical protein
MAPSNIQSFTVPSRESLRSSPGASVQGIRGANDFIDVSDSSQLIGIRGWLSSVAAGLRAHGSVLLFPL